MRYELLAAARARRSHSPPPSIIVFPVVPNPFAVCAALRAASHLRDASVEPGTAVRPGVQLRVFSVVSTFNCIDCDSDDNALVVMLGRVGCSGGSLSDEWRGSSARRE